MVFCKECRQKVEECPHFVSPLAGERVRVVDEKIETLAYSDRDRILEIAFKGGQVWQLFGVPSAIYHELRDSTMSSFLKFIAQRYKRAPVRAALRTTVVPQSETCSNCRSNMKERHRRESAFGKIVKVVWTCPQCGRSEWKTYEGNVTDAGRRASR
jgi:hypothetical protein